MEGLITVVIFNYILRLRPDILEKLKVIKPTLKETDENKGVVA